MLNNQTTFYPTYKRFQRKLWKMHINKKIDSEGKRLGIFNWFMESCFSYWFERYGYSKFDYLIVGNDPLIAMVAALEKVSLGKRVLILPNGPYDADDKINKISEIRSQMLTDSISRYLNEKYSLDLSDNNLSIDSLLASLIQRLNQFQDEYELPLCYLYKGYDLYSSTGKSGVFDGEQTFWPRYSATNFEKQWMLPSSSMNRFSLLIKSKKSDVKQIKSFLTAGKVILTTRTSIDFCNDYLNKPIELSDAAFPIDKMQKFNLQHRLADVLSAMSVNQIEKDQSFLSQFSQMYGDKNAR